MPQFYKFENKEVMVRLQKGAWYHPINFKPGKALRSADNWLRFKYVEDIGALVLSESLVEITPKEFRQMTKVPVKTILELLFRMEQEHLEAEIDWREHTIERTEGQLEYQKRQLRSLERKIDD